MEWTGADSNSRGNYLILEVVSITFEMVALSRWSNLPSWKARVHMTDVWSFLAAIPQLKNTNVLR